MSLKIKTSGALLFACRFLSLSLYGRISGLFSATWTQFPGVTTNGERGPLTVAWESVCGGVSTLVNCLLRARPCGCCNVSSSAISWTYRSSGLPLLPGKVTWQDMVVPCFFPGWWRNQTGSTAQHSKGRFPGGLGWGKYSKLSFISQTVNSSLPFSGHPWNWA